jgi:hypothetical protein
MTAKQGRMKMNLMKLTLEIEMTGRGKAGTPKRSSIEAQMLREEFVKYFISAQGKLQFQYDK